MRPINISKQRFEYLIKYIDLKEREWNKYPENSFTLAGIAACKDTNKMLKALEDPERKKFGLNWMYMECYKPLVESVVMHNPTSYLTIASYSVAKSQRMDLPIETFHVVREISLQNQSQMAFKAAISTE